jgi:hypothetical protein
MKKLNYNKLLLLCGTVFTIHNIEESAGYAFFTLPVTIQLPFSLPTPQPMICAIVAITIIGWIIFLVGIKSKNEKLKRNILAVTIASFFVNALFPHIVSAIVLQRYTPAVVTSLLLYLPCTFIMLPSLYRCYQPRSKFFKLVAIWLVVLAVVTVGLQVVLKYIFD